MITIGVVSDSHGDRDRLGTIMMMMEYKKVDGIIHLGDGWRDMEAYAAAFKNVWQVRGNCDFGSLEAEEMLTIGGKHIFITHGHHYRVKLTTELLAEEAHAAGADAALFGHTHEPYIDHYRGMLMLNPGSAHDGRYAFLKIFDNGMIDGELNYRP